MALLICPLASMATNTVANWSRQMMAAMKPKLPTRYSCSVVDMRKPKEA